MKESDKASLENHADHDGIVEEDNRLPNWWLVVLFGSIIFSLVYWYYYHILEIGLSQRQALAQEQKNIEIKMQKNNKSSINNELLLSLAQDSTQIKKGREIFQANCVACHGAQGEGGIGPNLTDEYWIHGGTPVKIYDTVKNGVVEKGMLAWNSVLGEEKMKNVVSYLISIKNTKISGKSPQGEKE